MRSSGRQSGLPLFVKRALDVGVSAAVLVATAPLQLVAAGMIRATMGAPVLFRQARPGKHGKPFVIRKFRTMTDARGPDGSLLPDELRLTRVGRALRATSVDELPQLWNVLRGEMSLVGPRPLLMQYLPRYSPAQARRHDVLPGLTGWAQVHGRNAVEWEDRLALDVWYVDHWSLRLDAEIVYRTFRQVVQREGIAREGHATMPEFMGSCGGASM